MESRDAEVARGEEHSGQAELNGHFQFTQITLDSGVGAGSGVVQAAGPESVRGAVEDRFGA